MSLIIEHAEHVTVQFGSDTAARDFLASLPTTTAFKAAHSPIPDNPTPLGEPLVSTKPGEVWPGQGLYAGICCAPDGRRWHLFVPPGAKDMFPEVKWGAYGTEIDGANDIYDGQANTAAMAAAGIVLAEEVQNSALGCYLPSRAEALLMFATLKDQLGDGSMWTSTQCSASGAWYQYFGYGTQGISSKDAELRAVAVRRLML
ncbi:hypothetical protein [Hydrogenophaga sp. ANAO-22]|uniref:hypothetical protein n=1 Tax=Hydrogenophaga sp. ANAO-22 TaxID=3166645 RepID=UPI0036D28208